MREIAQSRLEIAGGRAGGPARPPPRVENTNPGAIPNPAPRPVTAPKPNQAPGGNSAQSNVWGQCGGKKLDRPN